MKRHTLFTTVFTGFSALLFAQEKAIDTVFIQDQQLRNSEKTQNVITLKSADILKNATNLSDVLRFQSPVYLKENGRGMVSSPSFRGTTAQQTAFIWNGINVNSLSVGQADVNNISILTADEIKIKAGGGSVIYGSGAIGGSVHLDNTLKYKKGFTGDVFTEYGSFNTINSKLKAAYSNERFSFATSGSFVKSENDYEVPEKDYKNISGQYNNQSFLLHTAYKINAENTLSWITENFYSSQNFPVANEVLPKTSYKTYTFRSLLTHQYKTENLENYLRTAYLEDQFSYFAKIGAPKSSGGTGKIFLVKNDFNFKVLQKLSANLITEFQNQKAEGLNSAMEDPERNVYGLAGLLKFQLSKKIYAEGGLKKDFIEGITSPLLFSLAASFNASSWYHLKLSASKNFRNPSFSDLYSEFGGNTDLLAETSHQAEISNEFRFKSFKFILTPYLIDIQNLIQWVPMENGFYAPQNTKSVLSKGLESALSYSYERAGQELNAKINYSYTLSENKETRQQLLYVPFHKLNGSVDYRYGLFGLYVQGLYNGLTYTSSDEDLSTAISPYFIANMGAYVKFKNYKLSFKVNNLTDVVYETTAFYPMPKRNYALSFNMFFN